MSISINGSTGISGVDGSAATPALQGGDTNTGISFGTDEVRINTGGTQRAVVDANGRLGLGTSSPSELLHISTSANAIAQLQTSATNLYAGVNYINGDRSWYAGIRADASDGWGVRDETGTATRLLIDTSGNVGIGTISPQVDFQIGNADNASRSIVIHTANDGDARIRFREGSTVTSGYNEYSFGMKGADNAMTWESQGLGEIGRWDGAGRFLVRTSTSQGSYNLQCFGTGVWGQGAYVNGSDASLKDNVQDLESALDVVKALRPVTFQYKSEYSQDTSTQSGFIAQELQQAMQGKQYLDGIVKPGTNHLNVAYQGIIAVLVKAVQELEAEVQALKGGN